MPPCILHLPFATLRPNRNLLANLMPPIDFKRYYFPKHFAASARMPLSKTSS